MKISHRGGGLSEGGGGDRCPRGRLEGGRGGAKFALFCRPFWQEKKAQKCPPKCKNAQKLFKNARFSVYSACATPLCCIIACAVACTFLQGWWGSCGQQIQADVQGPVKQTLAQGHQLLSGSRDSRKKKRFGAGAEPRTRKRRTVQDPRGVKSKPFRSAFALFSG